MTKFEKLKVVLGKDKIQTNKDLTNLLTLHVKTKAEYYFEAKSKNDWQKAVKAAHDLDLPIFVLGGGSNIAVTKDKIEGLVIRNNYIKKEVIKQTNKEVEVLVSSGYPTGLFVNQMIEAGYEGIEYHKGLPGTIGGAIYMNSKWTRPLRYFRDGITKAVLLQRDGQFKTVDRKYFNFGYDYSTLHNSHEILVDVIFIFKKTDPTVLKKRADEAILYRTQTQPKGVSSCGCFFRNISERDKIRLGLPTNSVGYLIDQLGLKGTNVGSFAVSETHGNFIINKDGAKSDINNLKKLLKLIKDKVREKYGIELEEEVIVI